MLAVRVLGEKLGLPVVFASLVTLPAIGATIGYRRSDRRERETAAPSGALISVSDGRARLSMPAVSFGLDSSGLSLSAPLAGGSF